MTQPDTNSGIEDLESDFDVLTSNSLAGLQTQLENVEGGQWRLVNVVYDHSFIAFLQRIK